MVLSPWRNNAYPLPPQLVEFVPEMSNSPPQSARRQASSLSLLSIIQHNCLGSWDVFLSLFESFKETNIYTSVVFLQDPRVSQPGLPSFNGYVPFFSTSQEAQAGILRSSFLSCSFFGTAKVHG